MGRKRRSVRRWLIAGSVLVIAVVSGYAVFHRVFDRERLRAFAEAYLQEYFQGAVTVAGARFSWPSDIVLYDVRLSSFAPEGEHAVRSPADPPGEVFQCRKVELSARARSLLAGKLEIDSITALAPEWTIRQDDESGLTNLHDLVRFERLSTSRSGDELPRLELRDAVVRVVRRGVQSERVVEDLRLTVRGRPSERDAQWYDVVWSRSDAVAVSGHSQIDLTNRRFRNVRGGLPWLSLEAVAMAIDSTMGSATSWVDLLGLEGSVRASDYNFGGGDPGSSPASAHLELENATLAIPLPGAPRSADPAARFLRFENVYGAVELAADSVRAQFDGTLRGSRCRAALDWQAKGPRLSSIDDVDVNARLSIREMRLPRGSGESSDGELDFIHQWPNLAQVYRRFDPHGPVDLELEVGKRAGAEQPLELRYWMVRALGGDASFINFPYRMHDLTGVVVGTPGGIWIDSLRGFQDGAEVEVNGWYSGATPCAEAHIEVKASHVPLDEPFCEAMTPRFRHILDRFAPQGEIDFRVILKRPACTEFEPVDWEQTVVINFPGIDATYAGFPYPVTDLTGSVLVREQGIEISSLSGRCGAGTAHITGRSGFFDDGSHNVDLAITARDVVIDDALLTALPGRVAAKVQALHPHGRLDVELAVRQDRFADHPDVDARIDLQQVAWRHEAFPIPVTEVSGHLYLRGDRVELVNIEGQVSGGGFTARGGIEGLTRDRPDFELFVQAPRFTIQEEHYALAPAPWVSALNDWRVLGPVTAEASVQRTGNDAPQVNPRWTLNLHLDRAEVRHPRTAQPVTNVEGTIQLSDHGMECERLDGSYGDARFTASLTTQHQGEHSAGSIRFQADGLPMDDSLRNLLPPGSQAVWDRLSPHGRLDVALKRLEYRNDPDDGKRLWSLAGEIRLHDAGAATAISVDEGGGVIRVEGMLVDQSGGATLSGDLRLDSVELLGRTLENVSGAWSYARTADGRGRLRLEGLEGHLYGGSASGEVELRFDPGGAEYHLTTTAFQIDVDRFINAPRLNVPGREPVQIGGTLDARLQIAGRVGDNSSRSGGGRVEIIDGSIYRLPLILAILNVINLSPPDQEMFADAAADLYIVGSRIDLRNIELRGSLLTLVGSGDVSWPDLGLDVTLFNVHNRNWTRVPGLTDFVDRASRELVELHVTGSPEKPAVRARPVPALSDEFRELFQKKKPTRIGSAPS